MRKWGREQVFTEYLKITKRQKERREENQGCEIKGNGRRPSGQCRYREAWWAWVEHQRRFTRLGEKREEQGKVNEIMQKLREI